MTSHKKLLNRYIDDWPRYYQRLPVLKFQFSIIVLFEEANLFYSIEFTVVVEARTPFRLRRSSKKKSIIITLPLTPYFELRSL